MRPVTRRLVPISLGGVTAAVLCCACSSAGNPVPQVSTGPVTLAGSPYSLYTHCGVREARVGSVYYVADHPLDDGQGNPPPGWGNPYQNGSMTTPAPGTAIFRDLRGHVVRFHARPGAKAFLQICS